MDQDFLVARAQGARDRGGLDELGPGTDNGKDSHGAAILARMSRAFVD
jgi:hypothetical protein